MSSVSKVNKATSNDTDWTFVGDLLVMDAVERAVRYGSNVFSDSEAEDLRQDALLFLSVRPELIDDYRTRFQGEGFVKLLAKQIYSHGLRDGLIRESDRASVTVQIDEDLV